MPFPYTNTRLSTLHISPNLIHTLTFKVETIITLSLQMGKLTTSEFQTVAQDHTISKW